MSFGQIMRGDRLTNSLYKIQYMLEVPTTEMCTKSLSLEDLDKLRDAIGETYMFEMFIADLPVVRPIGIKALDFTQTPRYHLVNKLGFNIGYNPGFDEIVSVNITTIDAIDITTATQLDVTFSYSVTWSPSQIHPASRLQKQLTGSLTSHQSLKVHWLSIINSFVLVLLIVSLLMVGIMRFVRSDLSRYLHIPEDDFCTGVEEETGWKLLHADVFRPPPHRIWFSACVGSGAQIFFVMLSLLVLGTTGIYYRRGVLVSVGGTCYMITAAIGGYVSAHLYASLGGQKWAWNIVLTALMFSGPAFIAWSFLNSVAIAYESTAAFPALTILFLFTLYLFVTLPLTIIGGIWGRKRAQTVNPFPRKTNKLAREIPTSRWYYSLWVQMFLGGCLPFSAIYIELHYVFLSLWGAKVYTLYGILCLSLLMLILVSATVTLLLTYFHLNAEDYRWWWRSLASGGSVAIFFYLYCIYYYYAASRMFGFLQVSFYFSYSLLVAWGVFLMMGFVSYFSSFGFVKYMYSRIKCD
eukprot:GHVL01028449.1.p1 GENE.GHVL01028449.1~~GHVL01028449.1.p1  ORF type:complete len:522 (+),score=21.24 GHVL01028449.1:229-1794(+)